MAEPLKNMYNPPFFERLCPVLKEVIPQFEERKFIYTVFNQLWPDLALKQRTRQITLALHDLMPVEFPKAAGMLVAISDLLRKNNEKEQSYPLIFLPDYIECYGQYNFEVSMKAIQEITKLVSAEFAIRPFIVNYPDRAMEQMVLWSTHQDASVRRLSSEGCRPRLPWAMRLPAFINDPSPILPILENLKKDSSEYVRRSVANNINDIAKDHPELVLKTVQKWKGENPATQWIIKHGCRTLLKKGSEGVLNFHGFKPKNKSRVSALKALKKIKIGDCLNFDFVFCNQEKKQERFRLEYAIHYITSTGKTSLKVFKIGEYTVEPAEVVQIKRKQSFKDFTTRKHYKGKHRLSILVNGREKTFVAFRVY
jgi:3-methyladenine DNA glycosylase AlkC